MAGDMKTLPLNRLYEFSAGLSKPRSAFGSGYPFLTFKDVFYNSSVPEELTELVNSTEQERSRCSIRRGDVFVTRTSETIDELGMSCVALCDIPNATFNGFTKRLRPKDPETVVPEYARYYFRAPRFRQAVTAMSSLSTRASLNNEMLARLSILLPPREEQESIGRILGTLDDKIELNRWMKETLEAMMRVLFKSWFVNFDPVRAKAEGHDLRMPQPVAELFPDSYEDSDLGEIPRGWKAPTLGEVLTESIVRVGAGNAPEYSSTNDGLQLRSERFTKKLSASSVKNKLIREGYLVFGLSRRVLNFGLMRDRLGSVSSAYKVFVVDKHRVVPDLLERLMRLQPKYFYNAVSASSREGQSISTDGLAQMRFVQPPPELQREFYRMCGPLFAQRDALEEQVNTLSALRDVLLPKLISGELRLREAEKCIGGAAS